MKDFIRNIICIWLVALAMLSCNSNDCPLNNSVRLVCGFYDAANDSSLVVSDTITIAVRDSVIGYGQPANELQQRGRHPGVPLHA